MKCPTDPQGGDVGGACAFYPTKERMYLCGGSVVLFHRTFWRSSALSDLGPHVFRASKFSKPEEGRESLKTMGEPCPVVACWHASTRNHEICGQVVLAFSSCERTRAVRGRQLALKNARGSGTLSRIAAQPKTLRITRRRSNKNRLEEGGPHSGEERMGKEGGPHLPDGQRCVARLFESRSCRDTVMEGRGDGLWLNRCVWVRVTQRLVLLEPLPPSAAQGRL